MRLPRFASAFRRRLRRQYFTPLELAAIARNPSYRAPAAADLRDEFVFQSPGPHASPEDWGARDLVYRDGQLAGLSMSGRAFIAARHWIEQRAVMEARLVAVQPYIEELADCPQLAQLRRLDLTGCRIGVYGAKALAASPFLGQLRELILSKNDLGNEGLLTIAAAPWFADLTVLKLAGNNLGQPDSLAKCVGLRELDLSKNRLESPFELPTGPRRLVLSECSLGPASIERHAAAGLFNSVVDLDISFNGIGPGGVAPLAGLRDCRRLNLAFNDIEDAGLELLDEGEGPLEWLDLSSNRLTSVAMAAMAHSRAFEAVQTLKVATNSIGDAGAMELMQSERLGSLADLDVSNCGLTDEGIAALARSGTLGGLTRLSLAWNAIDDDGLRALATCPDLAALRELDLTGTPIGYAGASALRDSSCLASLRSVRLGEMERLPADGVALLRERYNIE